MRQNTTKATAVATLLLLTLAGAQAQTNPPPMPMGPPPLPVAAAQFFFSDGGRPSGPFSLAEIRARIQAGLIKPDTLVWKVGTANWVAAKDLAEIAALFGQSVAPIVDRSAFFVGTWQLEAPGPRGTAGPVKITIVAAPNGTLTGTYSFVIAAYNTTASVPLTGTWKAQTIDATHFTLSLDLRLQLADEVKQISTVERLEIIDDNTLRDVADGTISKRISR